MTNIDNNQVKKAALPPQKIFWTFGQQYVYIFIQQ